MTKEELEAKEGTLHRTSEVEKLLDISKSTLKRLIKDKKIRAVKFGEDVQGNPWYISQSALDEYRSNKKAHFNTDPKPKA